MSSISLHPKEIQSIADEIAIRWSDQSESYFPMERLRAYSPSAENLGEQDLLGNTFGGDSRKHFPGVRVTGWDMVGGYGILFAFSDGHRTGIFSYDYLRHLAGILRN